MSKKIFTTESLSALVDNIKTYVTNAISTKADSSHTHDIDDVSGLQSVLDEKASSSHGVHVPSCSASNNGQFLRVVDGAASWSTVPNAEEATF